MMQYVTEVTEGVKISVSTQYEESYSNPRRSQFLFSYKINIENQNEFGVQLLKRHWCIYDSSGEYREIDGEGVIGKQPVISNYDSYHYESACNLVSDIGKMWGVYQMKRLSDDKIFEVRIPAFQMVVPVRLN